jgi:hypothetical protein
LAREAPALARRDATGHVVGGGLVIAIMVPLGLGTC